MLTTNATRHGTTLLKVASKSNPASVAGAIAGMIRETGRCEVQAIGAGAVNQTVKAIGIARGYVAPGGIDLIAEFTDGCQRRRPRSQRYYDVL